MRERWLERGGLIQTIMQAVNTTVDGGKWVEA